MTRVYVICEGATEERFIQKVLASELATMNIFLYPRIIGKPGHQGGNVTYSRMLKDIKLLLNDNSSFCTTFFDFYGLDKDFPGKSKANIIPINNIKEKQKIIHDELYKILSGSIAKQQLQRFIPYVQMYEFEALLFSSPKHLADEIGYDSLETKFAEIKNQFETPEHINNSKTTAPSKRIIALYKGYQKVIHGSSAASAIGIDNISNSCKLFANWVLQLKNLKSLE